MQVIRVLEARAVSSIKLVSVLLERVLPRYGVLAIPLVRKRRVTACRWVALLRK